jgi:demethylmenaquinone methyltransferase/2-methoxy-6-polyprenyl-1,4-benzoquinol methylase
MKNSVPKILSEQLAYYRARAAEYDEWWYRTGRYDRGEDHHSRWIKDIAELKSTVDNFSPCGRILEIAGGTGIWSEQLLPYCESLTVVDGSPEVLAINQAKLCSERVRYVEADLFEWAPNDQYDTVFFSFWLSHVPDEKFDSFWQLVHSCLAPGGRIFFIDSRRNSSSTAVDHVLPNQGSAMERRLNDGRAFKIYKLFYDPPVLENRLADIGWSVTVGQTSQFFIYGYGCPVNI